MVKKLIFLIVKNVNICMLLMISFILGDAKHSVLNQKNILIMKFTRFLA